MFTTREMYCLNGNKRIYGIAYIPCGVDEKLPLVIMSHGLGGTHRICVPYAERLAEQGIASYVFDFCGGGYESKSDGKTTEMSVMTEVSDLEAVIEAAKTWDFVDCNRIIAFGESQGGIVSAITAARHDEELSGLILLYPAFLVADHAHSEFKTLNDIPETSNYISWITVGRQYVTDIWDYDVYSEIINYKKKVLLIHGSEDSLVDISYSKRANNVYTNSELKTIQGGGHGFIGVYFEQAMKYITEYLAEIFC